MILLPLHPVSLVHKNSQGRGIIDSLHLLGGNNRSDRSKDFFEECSVCAILNTY